jgi:hypothetical protein
VGELAEETFTENNLTEIARTQGIRLASRAAQEAPDYLRGLLSWREQLKKGRLTIYLDTSAVDRQVNQLQGIAAPVTVGVLVGAGLPAARPALPRQDRPGGLRGGAGRRGYPPHQLPGPDAPATAPGPPPVSPFGQLPE